MASFSQYFVITEPVSGLIQLVAGNYAHAEADGAGQVITGPGGHDWGGCRRLSSRGHGGSRHRRGHGGLGVGGKGRAQKGECRCQGPSQMELNVTGQNVTNASTTGYSRKVVNLQAGVRQDATYGQVGMGVGVVDIQALRDAFLNQQYAGRLHRAGTAAADRHLAAVDPEHPDRTGEARAWTPTWTSSGSAWQNLANAPADPTARQAVSDAGMALAGRFHDIGTQLDTMVAQQNSQITTVTAQVNQLLTDIAADNSTIAQANVGPGGRPTTPWTPANRR